VWSDPETSRSVYNFVFDLCVSSAPSRKTGAVREICRRRAVLDRPASAARALQNGALYIERADSSSAHRQAEGLSHPAIDAQVALVDARLEANRKKAAA